ncbi:MAG: ribosomal protein [Clostridia bacterium]|jgi:large subunit ribosomal protein L10|nr:ribosomal protein [Clostridia bacterium]
MPSEKILKQKMDQAASLAEKLKKAKMVIFTEYRGISVSDDTKLRNTLRSENNECMVVKNSVINHAANDVGIKGLDTVLEGPTAVIIGYDDYVSPAKALNEYAKTHDFYKFKAGIMDGKVITSEEVKKLANLPSKETLYAMVASALIGNIRNLAVVLDQTREKQEANA